MLPERRRVVRAKWVVEASCRVDGVGHPVRLLNMSKAGCCAEASLPGAVPGDRVLLQLTDLVVLPATIRWVRGWRTGLAFTNPLHGALLCEFAKRQKSGSEAG